MIANGKVVVIRYAEHILYIGACPWAFLLEVGHTADLVGSSRRRNISVSLTNANNF